MSTLTAAARDPEALTSAPRGCARRWLPWTLGVAALLVLVAVGAALAVRSWAVPSAPVCALCAPGSPPSPSPAADHLGSPGALAVPRQAIYGQLVLREVQLNDGTLNWYSDPGITGVFLAQGLSYHEAQRELEVAVSGIYYVFLHLELKRVQSSSGKDEDSETVTVTLHLQPQGPAAFTLPVVLSSASSLAGGSQGLMLRLDARQRLSVRMSASQSVLDKSGRLSSWQISQGTLGLFLVAAED